LFLSKFIWFKPKSKKFQPYKNRVKVYYYNKIFIVFFQIQSWQEFMAHTVLYEKELILYILHTFVLVNTYVDHLSRVCVVILFQICSSLKRFVCGGSNIVDKCSFASLRNLFV